MANNKSAEKRHRQNLERRDRNRSNRSRMRHAIRNLRSAVDSEDGAKAQELLGSTLSLIDTTARKGVIHRNTAARYKSRLSKAVAALAKA
ncbi:MAG: 30S ribosomal protein S20 [Acidobacteriota bacterium]